MKKLSLIVSSCLLSTSVFAASTVDEAFKNGKVEGSISVYSVSQKFKKTDRETRNNGFGNGNLTIGYTTGDFYGLSLKTEAKGNLKLWEKHKDDRKGEFENNALITQALVQYDLENVISAKAGRYEGEFEWLSDYQQGGVIQVLAIPDTVVSLAYSNRRAESGIDKSEDFHKVNKKVKKGVYVLDVQNTSIDGLTVNPYYYSIKDITNFYGLKLAFDNDYFGAVAHYAKSNAKNGAVVLDDNGNEEKVKDGSILHLEATAKIEDFNAKLGYIKAKKKTGVAGMDLFGDNINPFEEGDKVYEAGAKTVYAGLGYTIADVELGALYGITKYDDKNPSGQAVKYKEKELNLSVAYNVTESLNLSAVYVNVKNNNKDDDKLEDNYNKYLASVTYSF